MMPSMVPRSILVSIAVALVLTPALAADRQVVVAVGADVESFNEYVTSSTLALDIAGQLFIGLMEELPTPPRTPPAFGPRLARSWTVAPDGLSVSFVLRDDVLWSDGRPTTAEDVRYTWQVQTDPALGWADADIKSNIRDVRVDGPHQVTFLLKTAGQHTLLDINEGHIIPKHAWSTIPVSEWLRTDFSMKLVTNGPFRLASWKPAQAIALERNPGYYEKGQPGLDRVLFRIVPDPHIRLQQLLAGETDVLETVAPESVGRITDEASLRIVRIDQRMFTYVCWNMRRSLFRDARVRRALTMALDRDAILQSLAGGMGRPSAGPIVSSLWAADDTIRPLPLDRAAARRLLDESGWKDGDGDGVREKDGRTFSFDIEFNRGNTLREKIALNAAAQLLEVGIRAVPRAVEWAAFQSKHSEGDFDAFVGSRIASTRVNLDSWTTGSPRNNAGYASPGFDALNAKALAAVSMEEARPIWMQAQRLIAEDQPVTFLFEQDRLYAVRRSIDGIDEGSLGLFEGLRKWSLRSDARPSREAAH